MPACCRVGARAPEAEEAAVVVAAVVLRVVAGAMPILGEGSPSAGKAKFDQTRAIVVFAGKSQGHQVAVLDPKDVLMSGASYVLDASSAALKAGKAADTKDSKIQMKGTFAKNKDGVVACQGQAAALMAKCQPASAKVQPAAPSLSNRFSPLIKGSIGRYGPHVTSPVGAAVVALPGNAGKGGTKNEQQPVQQQRPVQQPAKPGGTERTERTAKECVPG